MVDSESFQVEGVVRSLTEEALRCHGVAQQARLDQLERADSALREEVAALRHCLEDAGVLQEAQFHAQLHRDRFANARRAHPWRPEASMDHVLRVSGVALALARAAGPETASRLREVSRDTHSATAAVLESVRRMFPTKLYVCGGHDGGQQLLSTECFDPARGTWEEVPPMSMRRSAAAAATLDRKLYVCGGFSAMRNLREVERFDPDVGAWEEVASMLTARQSAAAAALAGRLYVCGGCGKEESLRLRSLEVFDPSQGTGWEPMPDMSTPRESPAVAVVAGQVYACGGFDGAQELSSSERFTPCSGSWEATAPLLTRRGWVSAAVGAGVLYVCGGVSALQRLSSVERYCPERDSWEVVSQMSMSRVASAVAFASNRLYVCGGFDVPQRLSSVERFDPERGTWEPVAPMLTRRAWAASAVINGVP